MHRQKSTPSRACRDIRTLALMLGALVLLAAPAPVLAGIKQDQSSQLIVPGADLLATGYSKLAEALAQLVPSLLAPLPNTTNGSDHQQTLIANGLAPDHLLVLVNGVRHHSSALLNLSNTVGQGSMGPDLTTIPMAMIKQVVITQGTGAGRFGSDAVAAVIDIQLKDAADQSSLTVQYGLNSGELSGIPELDSVGLQNQRVNLYYAGDRNVDDGDGDVLWLTGNWGFELGQGGFAQLGADYRDQDPTNRSGFDPRTQYPLAADGSFDAREAIADRLNHQFGQASAEQFNLLFNASIPISDNLELFGSGSIGSLSTDTAAEFRRPLDVRNIPALYPNGYRPEIASDIDDRTLLVGIRGDLFGWHWDLLTKLGETELDWAVNDSLNASFGALSPTDFSVGVNESRENTFTLRAMRSWHTQVPFELSLGIESRAEEYEVEQGELASFANGDQTPAPLQGLEVGSQGFPGFQTSKLEVDRDTLGLYGQLDAHPGARSHLSIAARFDDYSDIGGQFSGHARYRYDFSDQLSAHAALATGIRAPKLAQSAYQHTTTLLQATGSTTERGIVGVDHPAAQALGAQELQEETFSSIRAGLIYAPRKDLHLSVDLYRIELEDRVLLSNLLEGTDVASAFNSAAVVGFSGAQYFYNAMDTRATGLDLTAAYTYPSKYGAISLSLAANLNDLDVTSTEPNPAQLQASDSQRLSQSSITAIEDGTPQSKFIGSIEWQRERLHLLARAVRYSRVTDPHRDQDIRAAILLDVAMSYQATPLITATLGVNNGLDSYPNTRSAEDGAVASELINPYSSYTPYGTNGRFVYLRLSVR